MAIVISKVIQVEIFLNNFFKKCIKTPVLCVLIDLFIIGNYNLIMLLFLLKKLEKYASQYYIIRNEITENNYIKMERNLVQCRNQKMRQVKRM